MPSSHAESSIDLLHRLQAGDTAALDTLIGRYRPRLVRWATGRLPAHARHLAETQDLVQDTLVQAFRKIGQIEVRGEGALQAYLRQVLLNTIRQEIRKVRCRPAGEDLEVEIDGGGEYAPLTEGRVKTVTNLLIVNQQPGTDWSLTTYDLGPSRLVQSSRKVFFDLRSKETSDGVVPDGYARFSETPTLGTVGGSAVPYGRVTAHLTTKCSEASPVIDFRTMTLDQVAYCPGSLRFLDVAGQWYRLSFAPNNFAGVNQFKVTCTSVDNKGCKTWRVSPETQTNPTDPSQQGLQRLLKIDSGGAIQAVGGLYYLSFSFSLRRL